MANQYIDQHYRGNVERGTGSRGVSRQATVPCLSGPQHPSVPPSKGVKRVNSGRLRVITP